MEDKQLRFDNNGTKYYQEGTILLFECQYCGTWFETKRRFNQKYCCNSCRTLASKHRQSNGLGGVLERDKTSNTQIAKSIEKLNERLGELENDLNKKEIKSTKVQNEILSKLSTDRWLHILNLITSCITAWQTYSLKIEQNKSTEEIEKSKEVVNTFKLEIMKLASENKEVMKAVKDNESLQNIFNNLI